MFYLLVVLCQNQNNVRMSSTIFYLWAIILPYMWPIIFFSAVKILFLRGLRILWYLKKNVCVILPVNLFPHRQYFLTVGLHNTSFIFASKIIPEIGNKWLLINIRFIFNLSNLYTSSTSQVRTSIYLFICLSNEDKLFKMNVKINILYLIIPHKLCK